MSDERVPRGSAVGRAVREAARFDRSAVSWSAGLLASIPVVAVFAAGVIGNDPVAAATMGAGAMLVGIAWRVGGGRAPRALMVTDAVVMALATLLGSWTGTNSWVHLIVLAMWCLGAGLVVAVGRRGAVVGTQAVIAFVVFGRFGQSLSGALGLAGLVLGGGLAQALFQTAVRWPPALRIQRQAVAAAYRALAALARAPRDASPVPAGTALDEAELTVASPTLFGDEAFLRLRSLVDEGRRLRLELNAIRILLRQRAAASTGGQAFPGVFERVLELAAGALARAAEAIEGRRDAPAQFDHAVSELSAAADALRRNAATPGREAADGDAELIDEQVTRRFSALAGQLRAVRGLVYAAGESGRLISRRPRRGARRPGERLRGDLALMRANASLDSPAGRHAVRLAVIVVATAVLSRHLPLQRSYWMVVAAAAALRPEFGATFTRGAERILGTCAGVALAGLIAVTLHPSLDATIVIIAVLAWAAYSLFPASFAVGFAFITALVVFLLDVVNAGTLTTAGDRLVDTLVGGAIALLAYVLWPTWSRLPARQAIGDLIDAQRRYLGAVLGAIVDGRPPTDEQVRPPARAARLARTNADDAVARSLSEPATRRIGREKTRAALAALRRLVEAVHVIRLAQEEDGREPLYTLGPLAAGLETALQQIAASARSDGTPLGNALPPLRSLYTRFADGPDGHRAGAIMLAELDEIVDAVNTLGAVAGLRAEQADHERDRAATG